MRFHALLVSAGLPDGGRSDLAALEAALEKLPDFRKEDIRIMGGDLSVTCASFLRALTEFSSMLGREDAFLFYFTGHGTGRGLVFDDGVLPLQSLVDYLARMPSHACLVLLDCCYAGAFTTGLPAPLDLEETVRSFAGRGICVLASSAADQVSRMLGSYSIFTSLVCQALGNPACRSVHDLSRIVRRGMETWNALEPERRQQTICRSSMHGSLYLRPPKDRGPQPLGLVRDTHVLWARRREGKGDLVLYVLTDRESDFPAIAARLSEEEKDASRVRVCFGLSESDLVRSLHYLVIVMEKGEVRSILPNRSYQLLKDMQEPDLSPEEERQVLASYIRALAAEAAPLFRNLEEAGNGLLSYEAVSRASEGNLVRLRTLCARMEDLSYSDALLPLYEEADAMAGGLTELFLLLEGDPDPDRIALQVRACQDALERLRTLAPLS